MAMQPYGFKQQSAVKGWNNMPSAKTLDSFLNGYYEVAANNAARNKELTDRQEYDAEVRRMRQEEIDAQSKQGVASSLTNVATTGGMLFKDQLLNGATKLGGKVRNLWSPSSEAPLQSSSSLVDLSSGTVPTETTSALGDMSTPLYEGYSYPTSELTPSAVDTLSAEPLYEGYSALQGTPSEVIAPVADAASTSIPSATGIPSVTGELAMEPMADLASEAALAGMETGGEMFGGTVANQAANIGMETGIDTLSSSLAGTAGSTVGSTLGSALSAASTAGPIAAAGIAATKLGGGFLEELGNKNAGGDTAAKIGRTVQKAWGSEGGIVRPWLKEIFGESETRDKIMDVLNPISPIFKLFGK